jgi:hypothetical protein
MGQLGSDGACRNCATARYGLLAAPFDSFLADFLHAPRVNPIALICCFVLSPEVELPADDGGHHWSHIRGAILSLSTTPCIFPVD